MNVIIERIAYALPETVITNEELRAQHPGWDFEHLEDRTGVFQRHIAHQGETALDLAEKACHTLIPDAGAEFADIDGLIFCTETPDHPIPSNACLLHGRLGLPQNVLSLDINMGCSGYIYSLEVARSLIVNGTAQKILLVTGDTYSRFISPEDRATTVLFGDGAAVSIVSGQNGTSGIVDTSLGSDGKHYSRFMVPAGGARQPISAETAERTVDRSGNIRSAEEITMDGIGVLSFFNATIPGAVTTLLRRNDLDITDIDLFFFHQASRIALASLQRALSISDGQMYVSLATVGNLVSASIPVALKMAADEGRLRPGSRIILCGFGVGLSWGTTLLQIPEVIDL
jgi:3-oxoacyl-[acyl-carrier-protein] synthase-3